MVAAAPNLPSHFGDLTLAEAAAMIGDQKLPPVELWNPADHGDSHMEIRADGGWWHRGGAIKRSALVTLFESILRREADGSYALVTPHERQSIAVADLPFRAVEVVSEGTGPNRQLVFRLGNGQMILAGADHPLCFGSTDGEPRPSLHVRGPLGQGLSARLTRSLFYELVDMAIADGAEPLAIWSGGVRFVIGA